MNFLKSFTGNRNKISSGQPVRILQRDKEKQIVAVIVTFCGGSSYDNLFSVQQQKTQEGTSVSVYAVESHGVIQILQALKKNQTKVENIKYLLEDIKQVDSDCVVFNWECCSSYSGKSFPQGADVVIQFTKMMLDKGFMTMFSDFSLKALINQWNQKILGPKPFKQINQIGGNVKLSFDCQKLCYSPSAQLQIVGQMANSGYCNFNAAGGTIVYTCNEKSLEKNQFYDLQILTVASSLKNYNDFCKIGEQSGPAGHVLLKYKSGGNLLTSMGHWAELMQIDTSQKTLFELAKCQYGEKQATRMREQYQCLDQNSKKQYVQRNAVQFVQNQAPCKNMSRKARSKY